MPASGSMSAPIATLCSSRNRVTVACTALMAQPLAPHPGERKRQQVLQLDPDSVKKIESAEAVVHPNPVSSLLPAKRRFE